MERIAGNTVGTLVLPRGFLLHGTQSGVPSNKRDEYERTIRFVRNGAIDSQGSRLGWNTTIAEDRYCIHSEGRWGWNARQHSSQWVAAEFAQSMIDEPITDDQIDMFVHYANAEQPLIPRVLIMHSETEAGVSDGKTDPARRGVLADRLRARVMERLVA